MKVSITKNGELRLKAFESWEIYALNLMFKDKSLWKIANLEEKEVSHNLDSAVLTLKKIAKEEKNECPLPSDSVCITNSFEHPIESFKKPQAIDDSSQETPAREALPDSDPSREDIIEGLQKLGYTVSTRTRTKTLHIKLKELQEQNKSSETDYLKSFTSKNKEDKEIQEDKPAANTGIVTLTDFNALLSKYLEVFDHSEALTLFKTHGSKNISGLSDKARKEVYSIMEEKLKEKQTDSADKGDVVPF